jgi:hypothetical protein
MITRTRTARITAAVAAGFAAAALVAGPIATASAATSGTTASGTTTDCFVKAGHFLHSGDTICVGHQYTLELRSDGDLVELGNGRVLWSTQTAGNPGAYFTMQGDANAVLLSASGKALWASRTNRGPNWQSRFKLGVNSNSAIWSNGAPGSDTLTASTLASGSYLHAQIARLDMQADGNLAAYAYRGGPALWSSRTSGHPGATATLQTDGNLVVRDTAGRALWSTGTAGTGSGNRLVVNASGHVKLSKGTTVLWAAN